MSDEGLEGTIGTYSRRDTLFYYSYTYLLILFLGLWSNRIGILVVCIRVASYNPVTTKTFWLGLFTVQFFIDRRAKCVSVVLGFL